jgi:hypothetical protein
MELRMLDKILKWIQPSSPVSIPRWEKFIYILKINANRYRTRYINDQYISNECTKMFERILTNIPVDKFLTEYSNDYTRFANIDDALVKNLGRTFDPTMNLKNPCNTIVKSTSKIVPEYYLNVSCDKPFTYMPMDKSWKNWEKLKSVRILYHDSRELCTDLLSMQVSFRKHHPTHLLVSIDLPAMIMQYVKYMEYNKEIGSDLDYRMFIKYHIIEPWHDDLIKIWLFNVFEDIVYDRFKLFQYHNSHNVISRGKLKAAKTNVYVQKGMVETRRITIGRFLSAKWLGSLSILKWMENLDSIAVIPDFSQYEHLKFMMELPYIKLIVKLCTLSDTTEDRKILKELKYHFSLYVRTNVAQKIVNSTHRNAVVKEVNELTEMLRNV